MKVIDYYNKTKPKLKERDLILIYAVEDLPNGDTIFHNLELPYDFERYPKIKDIEILRTRQRICNFSDFNFHGKNINGKLIEYEAIIKLEDLRKAKK